MPFIEWCVSRSLHVIWDFASIPGYAGGGPNGDILSSPDHYQQALELMELFSVRCADVPSGALSFYILGGSDSHYFREDELVKLTNDMTASLRQNSPDRGVHSNIWTDDAAGAFLSGWCEGLSKTNTTVGFELYPWDVPTLMGFPESSAANGRIYANGDKLTIRGNLQAGTTITFLLTAADGVGLGLNAVISADEHEIARLDCDVLNESHKRFLQRDDEYYVYLAGYPLTVTLEADAKEIALRYAFDDQTTMILLANIAIQTPSSHAQTYPEFYHRIGDVMTSWHYVTDMYKTIKVLCSNGWIGKPLDLPIITLPGDDSYEIDQQKSYFQTPESIREYVQKWADWGKRPISRFGCPSRVIRCHCPLRIEYLTCGVMLRRWRNIILETLFTDFQANWGPIIHKRALKDGISELPNSGYTEYGDFYLDEPVLEILREYLPN